MNREELEKLTDEELNQLIDSHTDQIKLLSILEYTQKLCINSAYGAVTSKTSPIGKDTLGNSITLCGQTVIKHVNRIAKDFLMLKDNSFNEEKAEKAIIFNDTDSVGVSLAGLKGVTICNNSEVTPEGYKIIGELGDYIDTKLDEFVKSEFNTDYSILSFKREKICDFGIYRKKKNYALHVIDNEGKVGHDGKLEHKWHYAGIELARAVMTKEIKELGKKVIEPMILKQDKFETDRLLQEAYDDFKELPLTTTCKLARIKTFDKYVRECEGFTTAKGMQQHVRAAYFYNKILDAEGLTKYPKLQQGDSCQVLPVKPNNKYRIDCIAFLNGELPEELMEVFEPDYKAIFKKPFYACISSLYDVCKWKCKDVTDEYNGTVFDLFD